MLTSSSEKTAQKWEEVFYALIDNFPTLVSEEIFKERKFEELMLNNSGKAKNDFERISALRLLNIISTVFLFMIVIIC